MAPMEDQGLDVVGHEVEWLRFLPRLTTDQDHSSQELLYPVAVEEADRERPDSAV